MVNIAQDCEGSTPFLAKTNVCQHAVVAGPAEGVLFYLDDSRVVGNSRSPLWRSHANFVLHTVASMLYYNS